MPTAVLTAPFAILPLLVSLQIPQGESGKPAGGTEVAAASRPSSESQDNAPASAPASKPGPESRKEDKGFYVDARSTGTRRDTEPPRYVRRLGVTPIEDLSWLELGLDYRLRYEYRDDDFRRNDQVFDDPFMKRTRAYVGAKDKFDPFRFGVEFEDARRANSQFAEDDRDVNKNEIIQAFGELYFEDALGKDRPFRVQVGRMAFEYVDRRLVARNEWRNTTNNFEGARVILGQQKNDWQLDLFALNPVRRRIDLPDNANGEQQFYGAVGDIRAWSDVVTLQPYYFLLHQDGTAKTINREIHTVGLRGYGVAKAPGFDYDLQQILQFGNSNERTHQAWAATAEVGYAFEGDWKPRASAFIGYASGDRDPNDSKSQRFDRLFGFARPWSNNDYIQFENVIAPKVRYEFQPHERLAIDTGYNTYWLAAAKDSWGAARLQDKTGDSGTFLGHELDVRFRIKVWDRIDITIGYAHFIPGGFPRSLGKNKDSDFLYVELSPRLLK